MVRIEYDTILLDLNTGFGFPIIIDIYILWILLVTKKVVIWNSIRLVLEWRELGYRVIDDWNKEVICIRIL